MTHSGGAAGSRIRSNRRGTIVVLACFFLIIAFGLLAFVVDIGRIVTTQTELQNAADAASMAGARALRLGPSSARSSAINLAAYNEAGGSSVVLDGAIDVQIGEWDEDTATFTVLSGADENEGNAVRVTCERAAARSNALNLFIAPLIGIAETDVGAFAIARAEPLTCGMFIGLNKFEMHNGSYTDSYKSNDGPYNPSTAGVMGHVCSNSDIRLRNDTAVKGDAHPGPGMTLDSSSSIGVLGDVEVLKDPLSLPAVDPFNASTVNDNASIPFSDDGNEVLGVDGKFTLNDEDHVTVSAGTYYFHQLKVDGGATVSFSGPTVIYVETSINFQGGNVNNVSQIPSDLQIYGLGTNDVQISTDTNMYAAIYAPTSKIFHDTDADFFGVAAGQELIIKKNGGMHADESISFLISANNIVSLVQ